ncbi:MAG: hypothetical protein BAJALOKI2v1_90012 [Promethearchaeota archaeon]|nr:MAG: hypothetical protein BAJALOKI2v1_90012 [Candidatus Lokiarchaeota archaeon]
MMKKEVNSAKKVFKDAFDVLDDFFDERKKDIIEEKDKHSKKGKVALIKFSKSFLGKTDKIHFRILVGKKKEWGDRVYEAIYLGDKDKPYIYYFKVRRDKSLKKILKDFYFPDWEGYKKYEEFSSLDDFLEDAYENGIYYKGKKVKKVAALDALVDGITRSLEAIGEEVKEEKGVDNETVKKIAKVVAIAALTTVVSAALTPAAGIVVQEVAGGGSITGELIGQATKAAVQGTQQLFDPTNMAQKVIKKTISKGLKLPISRE